MPIYSITDPEGKEWEIEGPAGASRDQVVRKITDSAPYKNYQYIKQQKGRKISAEALPDDSTVKGGDTTTSWLKATTPEEKYDPPAKDVLEAGRRAARDALKRSGQQVKNSDFSPEVKATLRQEYEKKLAAENADLLIDYDKLPIEKKLLFQAPGAGAVLGTGLAGFLVGGPLGAFAAGGTTLAALTGGGGEGQRAQLELQGVDPKRAKQVGLLEGIVKPGMQIGAATLGPAAGAVGVPFAAEAVDSMKNTLLQDQIQGPRTQEFPIKPFQQSLDDTLINALGGAASGTPGQTPPVLQARAPAGRMLPPPEPPMIPRPSDAGPRSPMPPPPPSGGSGPVVPKPGQTTRGAINERLATKLAEDLKAKPDIDVFLKAMEESPKTVTSTGKVVPTRPKVEDAKVISVTKNVPNLVLPPPSPNPLGPTPTITQDGRVATTAGRPDAANTSVKDDAQQILEGMSPQDRDTLQNDRLAPSWEGSKVPPELKADFKEWRNDFFDPADREVAMAPENIAETESRYMESVMDDPEHPYHTLAKTKTDSGPPEYGPGYEDSLGAKDTRFAPAEGKAPLPTLDKTATTPEVRQAIAAREPIETLPPNRRVQEGPGVSRQQVADQQALVKKLTYAGYREVKPGVWVHGDAPKKKVKDDPNWGKSKADRRPVTPDDVTEGNAYAREIYEIPDDVDRIERVWGRHPDGSFVPWIKNTRFTPAKINPQSTFIIANYDLDMEDRHPAGVFNHLRENVGWLNGLAIPSSWEEFVSIVGPAFLANGYDALSFRDEDEEARLVSFNPANITYIPHTTATTITGDKIKEHVRQMRNVLWMKRDTNHIQEASSLLKLHGFIKEGMSVKDLAAYARDNAPSQGLRSLNAQIAAVLAMYEEAGLLGNVVVKFKPFGNAAGSFKIDTPEYSKKARLEIFINSADGMTYRTITHELIHAVTIPVLTALRKTEDTDVPSEMSQRYYDLRKKMGEFYSFMQQMLATVPLDEDDNSHNRRMLKLLYNKSAWTENIHEVLAYALTEVEFQRILHSIPVKEGNGLFQTTEAVRDFHGISEDMNTLFFEAVKLFNEFAMQPIWAMKNLPKLLYDTPMAIYEAKPEIRGPPDFDKAVLTHLDDFATVMSMSQNTGMPYVVGRDKLFAEVLTIGGTLSPVHNGYHLFAFNQGKLPNNAPVQGRSVVPGQQPQLPAVPMYVMGVSTKEYGTWDAPRKTGQVIGNMVYFLVDNTDYPPIIGAMRRLAPSTFLDRQEAILLIRRKMDTQKAIAPYLEQDRTRVLIDMLPNVVAPSKKVKAQLEGATEWLDMPIEDALAIWRENPRDIAKAYNFWGQFVSGAETSAVLTNHPFLKWARGRISADIAEQSKMSKQVIQPMGEAYQAMTDAEKVRISKFLIEGDRKELEYDEKLLRQMGMTDNQVEYAMLVRDADNYLYDLWNEKRAYLGLPPVPFRKGHIPGIFEGDYHALVKLGDEIIGFVGADNAVTFRNRKRQIEGGNPGVTFTDLPKKRLDGAPLNGNLFDVYMELTKALGPNDPNIQNLQNILQEFAKFDENRYLGFHVHELAKKGIWGSSGDKPWLTEKENADDLFNALVRYFQEGTAHHNMLEFMQEMDKLFLDTEANEKAPVALRYLRDLYNHVLRHNPVVQGDYTSMGKIFKALGRAGDSTIEAALSATDMIGVGIGPTVLHKRSGEVRWLFATWAMGLGNLSFSFLQLMQVPMYAPQMTMVLRKELGMNFYEGRTAAAKASMSLAKYILHHMTNGKTDTFFGPLDKDKDTHLALTYAEDNNLINFTDIERALEHVVTPTHSKIDRVVNFNQRYAEALTRPLVFLWFYNLNMAAGLPKKEALESARHRTQFVMVPYDLRDRPMMYASLGTVGMAAGQLKTFMHSSTSQAWYYAKKLPKGHFAPFVYGTAMAMFFQGQMGLIGMQDVDNIVRGINQYVSNKNEGLKEIMYREAPKWFSKGYMTEWTGVDFYSRLRSPGMIQWPLQNSIIPPAYNWAYDQAAVTMRLSGAVAFKLKQDLETIKASEEFQRFLTTTTPPVFKGAVEDALGNPVLKKNAKPLKGFERDDFDRTLRYMGMRSARESEWMEADRDRKGDKYFMGKSLTEIKTALIEAYRKGDRRKEYVQQLEDAFFEKGGSVADFKALIKTLPPQTADDDFFGKPSKRNALRYNELMEIDKKRKEQ